MTSADKLLRDAAQRGELTHVSLTSHVDRNRKLTWRAMYRDATSGGQYHAEADDPVDAIVAALSQRPKRKTRNADEYDFG